jgi:hypothetical protein
MDTEILFLKIYESITTGAAAAAAAAAAASTISRTVFFFSLLSFHSSPRLKELSRTVFYFPFFTHFVFIFPGQFFSFPFFPFIRVRG